ncbi:MAG: D-alanyl-D-alanine carboxypeptidase/D-alanyl-D-alanine-endopeptidase [Pseudonocardia sp. SCN 73-27]|nr:MAG: D-alanyl-D-alanine carboxypeptidase/D-alanyl-D-alanine-endopeptidase [Pseudonocardia sp. SCN 72-51]ODV06839.1 MAG: D-alanyl-D-alanine carboxypeptidase/D-alanyl-D-alanine-endopeptidase [Pseudonocardia sp. SCN 73-27]
MGAAVLGVAACTNTPATTPVGNTAQTTGTPAPLPPAGDAVTKGPKYAISRWLAHTSDLKTGEELFALNAGDLTLAASTTKLWSTAAALDTFGPDFRFETPVYRHGADLVLVAVGDLTMGGRDTPQGTIDFRPLDHAEANDIPGASLTPEDPLAGLDDLAKQVKAAGISQVTGDVVIDARMFDQATKDTYVLSPIMINDNLVDLTITPGAAGAAATLVSRPVTAAFTINSTVTTSAADQPAAVTVTEDGTTITVSGTVPAGAPILRTAEVKDPQSFARTLFIEALARAGVAVSAAPTGANPVATLPAVGSYAPGDRVALHRSLPFSENIKLVNKVSMNRQADTLVVLIGAKNGKRTLDESMPLLAPFIRKAGIDPTTMSLADGRGNDYSDLFSPRTVATLLRYMATRPDFPVYKASMPIFGVDGTESTTVPADSPAAGKVQAKSGTTVAGDAMNGRGVIMVRGNAGYMTSKSGRECVVAAYVNHVPIAEVTGVFDVLEDVGAVVVSMWENS